MRKINNILIRFDENSMTNSFMNLISVLTHISKTLLCCNSYYVESTLYPIPQLEILYMSSYQPFYAFQINEDEECDEINEPLSSMTLGRRPFRVPQPSSTMTLGAAVKIQTEVHIQPPSPVTSSTTANVSESKYKTNDDDQDDKSPVKTRTPRISCKVSSHRSYRSTAEHIIFK